MLWGGWGERKRERAENYGNWEERKEVPTFPSSHRPPRAFYFFDYCYFHRGYPAGASAEERARSITGKHKAVSKIQWCLLK